MAYNENTVETERELVLVFMTTGEQLCRQHSDARTPLVESGVKALSGKGKVRLEEEYLNVMEGQEGLNQF